MSDQPAPQPAGSPPGEHDDPVALAIVALLAQPGAKGSIRPEEVARAYAAERAKPSDPPEAWRRYLLAVRQQALHLARAGRLVILRKGKAVDPTQPIKGVIRLALPPKSP